MSTHTDSAAAHGVRRGKLILIGVLGVVLVAVVYWNYFRDGTTSGATASLAGAPPAKRPVASAPAADARPGPAAGRRAAPAVTAATNVAAQDDSQDAVRRNPWPEFKLAAVLAHDPFALPSQFPQPPPSLAASAAIDTEELKAAKERAAAEERAATLEAIKQKGVELIFSQNGQGYVAKIGDKEVRVGDEIGGFRVVEIDLHGVTLEGVSTP